MINLAMNIKVVDYDEKWVQLFEKEALILRDNQKMKRLFSNSLKILKEFTPVFTW